MVVAETRCLRMAYMARRSYPVTGAEALDGYRDGAIVARWGGPDPNVVGRGSRRP